jgi:hypothetical protein
MEKQSRTDSPNAYATKNLVYTLTSNAIVKNARPRPPRLEFFEEKVVVEKARNGPPRLICFRSFFGVFFCLKKGEVFFFGQY